MFEFFESPDINECQSPERRNAPQDEEMKTESIKQD
jgi:hypothetical protein